MIKCPVCGEYDFQHDNDFDVCEICGWENDGVQLDDPDYRGGANKESLNEARAAWSADTSNDEYFRFLENIRKNLIACPCCGEKVFEEKGEFEICHICDWQDDPLQRKDPDMSGGANEESLNQYRSEWEQSKKS